MENLSQINELFDASRRGLALQGRNETANKLQQNYSAYEYSRSQDASLSILTKDGDVVEINYYSDYYQAAENFHTQGPHGSQSLHQSESEYSVGLHYSVSGHLDAQEQQAIDELMKQVEKIATNFFQGEANDDLLKDSLSINFDGQTLSAFDLNLSETETLSAIQTYQSIQDYPQQARQKSKPTANLQNPLPESISDFSKRMGQAFAPILSQSFVNEQKLFEQLLEHTLSEHPQSTKDNA